MSKKVAFMTLGCKTNLVESDAIMGVLAEEGFEIVSFDSEADYYVVNTCTVTHVSDRKSRQMIRRAKKHNPKGKVICMGCYTQLNFEKVQEMDVDLVLGNGNKNLAIEYIRNDSLSEQEVRNFFDTFRSVEIPESSKKDVFFSKNSNFKISNSKIEGGSGLKQETQGLPVAKSIFPIVVKDDLQSFEEIPLYIRASHTRAFVKIQDGCNRYCTYCIIPYARGDIRSRSLDSIRQEIEHLVQSGYTEFVLTGIHLASYGDDYRRQALRSAREKRRKGPTDSFGMEGIDIPSHIPNLLDVVETVNAVEGVRRIRLGSLEPMTVSADFEARMKNCDKLCDHFHLSLQSGTDHVLNLMNRQYTTKEFAEAAARLRRMYTNPSLTTDIIVGFPGETEEDFEQTKQFIEEIRFSDIHIFPYSERLGTPAVSFKNKVSPEEKKRRVHELEMVAERLRRDYLDDFIGKELDILVEENDGVLARGYTSNYIYVTTDDVSHRSGTYAKITYKG